MDNQRQNGYHKTWGSRYKRESAEGSAISAFGIASEKTLAMTGQTILLLLMICSVSSLGRYISLLMEISGFSQKIHVLLRKM